jgi:predicted outer membrane repeat protein
MTIITVTSSADQGSGSLRQAVYDAQSGDTIKFDGSLSNQKITLSSGLWLNKSLAFDGADAPNLTISGGNKTNIFWMGGVDQKLSLSVKNLTMADSYYDAAAGGAIWAQDNSTIDIDNVNFTGNVSDGAAVHAQQGSFITVNHSNFDHNDGASISDKEYATGAISLFAFGELKVSNSTFTNNKGFNGGAIHVTSSDLYVENSIFTGNDSTPGKDRINYIPGAGGAIYADAASVPNDEKFYGNLPEHELQGEAEGGVISINNSHFENNKAAGQGGALALWGYSQDKVIVTNNTIINNEVIKNKDNMAQGGGVWLMGFGTVENNTISNNSSEDQGGGLFIWGEVPSTISNTTFSGNQAVKGGAIYSDIWDGQVNINDTKFDSNAASVEGGVLFTNKIRPVFIQGSQFSNNTAGDIADRTFGSSISEVVYGTDSTDNLAGTDQNSYMFGLNSDDTLNGLGGNDYLDGGINNDMLDGGAGNDTLVGGEQSNTLVGGEGNDIFIGGKGIDLIEGGSGQDRFVIGNETQLYYADQPWSDHAVIKDFEQGQDVIQLKGQASDYTVQAASSEGLNGAGIFYQGGMIALVANMSADSLSLDAAAGFVTYSSAVVENNNSPVPTPVPTPMPDMTNETPVDPNAETPTDSEPPLTSSGLELTQDERFSGRPIYVPAENTGLFVWGNNNTWKIESTGDLDGSLFKGKIVADHAIEKLGSFKLEDNDFVRFTDDSHQVVEFSMKVGNKWTDGISFKVADQTKVFLEMEDRANVPIKVGASMIDGYSLQSAPMSWGLELNQDALFSDKPDYNPAQKSGLMVWNSEDVWHMEATGTPENTHYQGRIVCDRAIEDLGSYDFEDGDMLKYADDSHKVLEFSMTAHEGIDGISFKTPENANVFLELEDSDRVSVQAGASMEEINLV